ncbi:MAG: ammonium transporter [Rhizobiaceae bacterium]|jgi:Amt family ammonium transporter|nr:ammonium transporter [Rhizobiaceae bacterium]
MTLSRLSAAAAATGALALAAAPAHAATVNSGDVAWMMTSSLLVLMMSLPGLALFYGGLVRTKNMLSVMTQCFAIGSVMMLAWIAYGYSLAFTANGSEALNPYVGGLSKMFLSGVDYSSIAATFSNGIYIPEYAFIAFQMTFAVITPLLIIGALVERVKFSALLIFCILWSILAYYPMAHMVWYWGGPDVFGNASAAVQAATAAAAATTDTALLDAAKAALVTAGVAEADVAGLADAAAVLAAAEAKFAAVSADVGKLFGWGALDFAGGTVVHINAGVAGLVGCLVLGKRIGYGKELMAPHSLTMTMIGAALLWVGWFGFNAGSNLEANGVAAMAMLNTFVATAAAAVAWLFAEWVIKGKPSLLGTVSGVVAGLVAVTPACGWVGPMGAIIIGLIAGVVCFVASTMIKNALGYDDSLDVFGIHGVGGIIGALLTGIFVNPALGGAGIPDYVSQPGTLQVAEYVFSTAFMAQVKGVLLCVVWTGVVSFVLFKAIDMTIGLRVSADDERQGLDLTSHGERAYNY